MIFTFLEDSLNTFVSINVKYFISIILVIFMSAESYLHGNSSDPDTSSADKRNLYTAAAITGAYYAGSMYILSETWYKDRETAPFHFYDDSRAYLQVDKLGHTFGAYFYSYAGYHGLRELGLSRTESLIYGGSLGFMLQLPVEIMDGIHEGWGFSWSDLAANTAGSLIVIGQDLLFEEQFIKFKFSYWESPYSRKANGYLGANTFERILDDYNGHTYWLSAPVNKLIPNDILPGWLCIAAGYGANGMYGEYENITNFNGVDIPPAKRYRQFFLSADIDWTKIETDSSFLNAVLQGMFFIKMPAPAIEYNSLGQFKFHWIYY